MNSRSHTPSTSDAARRHSAHITIDSVGVHDFGKRYLMLYINLGGKRRRAIVSVDRLTVDPKATLIACGAGLISRSAHDEFLQRAQADVTRKATFRVATESGWFRKSFVLPNSEVIGNKVHVCLDTPARYATKFRTKGTLPVWQKLAKLAEGNATMMLSIALAFVGPLGELLSVETPVFQLIGEPGAGKTTMATAAGSVWGGGASKAAMAIAAGSFSGERPNDSFCESWNNTINNTEAVAAAYNATFLVLDETRSAGNNRQEIAQNILACVMRLSGGAMRGRKTDNAAQQPTWWMGILSTSNLSLDEIAAGTKERVDDAHRGRMIDVPVTTENVGAFANLHGFSDHAAFSDACRRMARENRGVAGRAYLEKLVQWRVKDEGGLQEWLRERRAFYLTLASRKLEANGRDLARINQMFATVYAAGRLAIKFDILPWDEKSFASALIECERAHIDFVAAYVARDVTRTPAKPWMALRSYVSANLAEFIDVDLEKPLSIDHDHKSCAGYIVSRAGCVEYFFSEAKLGQICGGSLGLNALRSDPTDGKWIKRDESRFSVKRTVAPGRRANGIAIDKAAFE
jgi:putative DNA primase/helicase